MAIRAFPAGFINAHAAKANLPGFMEDEMDNCGKLPVPNCVYNFPKLRAWHKWQHIGPIFQWELTEKWQIKSQY
jgi:hypothetical protein